MTCKPQVAQGTIVKNIDEQKLICQRSLLTEKKLNFKFQFLLMTSVTSYYLNLEYHRFKFPTSWKI